MEDFSPGRTLFDIERTRTEQKLLAAKADPVLRITPRPDGARVQLVGRFADGWATGVALGAALYDCTIRRGSARRLGGRFVADLEVAAPSGFDLRTIDFLRVALRPSQDPTLLPLYLETFFIDGSPDVGGCLYLEARGPADANFLGALLQRLTLAGLYPEEMTIETRAGICTATTLLRGAGGHVPDEQAERALLAILGDLLLGPTGAQRRRDEPAWR